MSRRETWSGRAEAFAAERAEADVRLPLRTLVERCALPSGSLVLDVATGTGYTARAFAAAGARTVALDPAHGMLLATVQGGTRAVVESWAEAFPFRDGSFDAVVSHRAPHEFADRDAFASETHRIVKPGGLLGIADQAPVDGWEDWHNDLERLRDPGHGRALSLREWTALLERHGFMVRSAELVGQDRDVRDWIDRVSTPPDAAARVLELCEHPPDALRDAYRPGWRDGRLHVVSLHVVVVAVR